MSDYNLKSISADTDGPSADTELLFGSPDQSSGTPKPYSFAGIKTWVKAWIAKGDVGLSNVVNTKHNLSASTDPSATDDTGSGYSAGSVWLRTDTGTSWVCRSATASAAVWVRFGIASHPGYTASRRYLFAGQYGATGTGNGLTAGRIYFRPVYVSEKITVSHILANVKTGQTSAKAQFAIYKQDPTVKHRPGALVQSTGDQAVATSSTNVEKALSSNAVLEPGWYFIAVNTDTSNVAFGSVSSVAFGDNQFIGADSLAGLLSDSTNSHHIEIYVAQTYGTWPSSLNGASFVEATIGSSFAPLFGMLIASVP